MIFQAGNVPSSETQGQSVGSGEKVGRKLSNTGERAPGYRLSSNYFQKFKLMPVPDWAQKCFVLLCEIGEQFLLSSFREGKLGTLVLRLWKNLSWDFEFFYIFRKNAVLNICRYLKGFYTHKKINNIFLKFHYYLLWMPKNIESG